VAEEAEKHPTFDRLVVHETHEQRGPAFPGSHIFRATDPAVQRNRVLKGNSAQLLVDGDQFNPSLLEAIAAAESSVHFQTFIFRRDRTGSELLDLLIDKARAGVEVRLLYDRFGSAYAHVTRFFERARQAGVQVRSISQANLVKGHFQVNLRNHRKVAVMDGRVGFVGGINIHDENLSSRADGPPIRDYHVKVRGPAVRDLQFQFVEDWHFASGEAPENLLAARYFPAPEVAGRALAQVVPGGPEIQGHGLSDAVFAAIVAAEKSVTIQTPYFVPDEPIWQAMRYAAMRGVAVRLIVPQKNNHWYIGFAARSLYGGLLRAGVRIFERRPPFAHAKAMEVDGVYAMVGSANLDYRSLHLNFETNIEVVDVEFVGALRNQLEYEIANSDEVDQEVFRRRPVYRRLLENFCMLFQPLL
jgi:cardiolipin synthase